MNVDVLVIGAGPAGLSAAQTASMHDATVGVVDDNALPGGQIWRQGPQYPASGTARALLEDLGARQNVALLSGARIVQALSAHTLLAERDGRALTIGYRKLIVATGARERFLPFPGWTLPGVTGAGGLQALIKGGTPVRGERIVIAGSGPLLWAAATTARVQGAHVVALVEQASSASVGRFARSLVRTPAKLLQAARMRAGLWRTPYLLDAYVSEATGDAGVREVRVAQAGSDRLIACDRLACAYGLLPNTAIAAALGCRVDTQGQVDAIAVDEWQATSVPAVFAAGECTGVGGMELSAVEGKIAALAAVGESERARPFFAERARYRRFAEHMHEAFELNPRLRTLPTPDTLFCRCEDVPYREMAQHTSWRDAKLHTRCGMGPCQGKVCGAAAAFCFGWQHSGEEMSRPPFSPVRIETLLQVGSDV
ncbi:FAD-dependent oxidoreductase [Paraburkholderia sp. RL17-337-BIB-A]|uniref:FAD-dependent oxidoreductase n=1 Tax=Paraburkholderia sp. RL17-337-BIB-A TaxID=3031636 RepID=UPI0038BAA771